MVEYVYGKINNGVCSKSEQVKSFYGVTAMLALLVFSGDYFDVCSPQCCCSLLTVLIVGVESVN